MYETSVRKLQEGDVLAKPIVGINGMMILGQGTQLTPYYIKRLIERGVNKVHIEQERVTKPAIKTGYQMPRRNRDFIYKATMTRVNTFMTTSVELSTWKQARLEHLLRQAMVDILAQPKAVELLFSLYEYDPYLFAHSLNVAIWSGLMGMERAYNSAQMLELTLGALLFDIGMTRMPVDIVQSDGVLSKDQWLKMKEHTSIGYHIMLGVEGMPQLSAECALQHHERFDGSGYPQRLPGKGITEYAQIVSLADCYDALISSRRHRGAYKVQEAIEFMFAAGNYYFDAELIRDFLRPIIAYPLSSILTLSSGQIGVVSSYRSAIAHRPVVRIIRESNGNAVTTPYELDLASACNITVVSCTCTA